MRSTSLDLDDGFAGSDAPLKHPPTILFILGLISVILGVLVGVYGIVNITSLSTPQQYFFGAIGYLLTVLIPIIFLQFVEVTHRSALEGNAENPYDIYAGQHLKSRMIRVSGFGLLAASLSIYVFFLPIAQQWAT